MTLKEYFGNWLEVIDVEELYKVRDKLKKVNPLLLCPHPNNIFKAFEYCSYENLKIIMLGYDPYSQKDVATGIMFGNNINTSENKISQSLNIIKEACINFEVPHNIINFDITLESWCKQGILMLNSALTCELGKTGSHVMIWRPFISKLLKNLSKKDSNLVYVLFGRQAKTFKPYISKYNTVLEIEHPSYFARTNTQMPSKLFEDINKIIINKYGTSIKWYQELT